MKIYNFDRHTGAYLGVCDASPSPMEPGQFLIPSFSTPIPPPGAQAGLVAVFDRAKNAWALIPVVKVTTPTPAPPSFAEKSAAWRADVAAHANAVAMAQGYDSMDEAVSYANEAAVPKYQIEGRALRAWRSLFWSAFDVLVAHIEMGKTAEPASAADLLGRLPGFTPPDTSAYGISGLLAGKS